MTRKKMVVKLGGSKRVESTDAKKESKRKSKKSSKDNHVEGGKNVN